MASTEPSIVEGTRSDAFPTSISALQLPSSAHNFSSILSVLKRSTLSPHNRLRSIYHDSQFVQFTAAGLNLPLIANERCGSWYIPPSHKAGSAYFKSTDGHFGQWAFSMRRLNLQALEIIGSASGCVIVDSTRRGKSMPDALSKTVPTWCVVLNRLLFPERVDMHELYTPKSSVAHSEHLQMDPRIHQFVQDAKNLQLDIPLLRAQIRRPLIPSWITPDSEDMTVDNSLKDYNKIICCTASRRVKGTEASENGYIQGAADDHEGWSHGLTPNMFWAHFRQLLDMKEEAIPDFVRQYNEAEKESIEDCVVKIPATSFFIGTLSDVTEASRYDAIIAICSGMSDAEPVDDAEDPKIRKTLHIPCKPGKLGSRSLRTHLSQIIAFLAPLFAANKPPRILIACPDGRDLSVGVALAVFCAFYDDSSNPRSTPFLTSIDKTLIRRRLAVLTAAKPDANPSRATLQSVHAFLMP